MVQFTKTLAVDSAQEEHPSELSLPGVHRDQSHEWSDLKTRKCLKKLESLHPMGRLGQPREVAYAALYLASDDSRHVTGTALTIDGGYTAW